MKTIVRKDILHSNHIAIADDRGNMITYRKLAEDADDLAHIIKERSLIFLLCDHYLETAGFLYKMLYLNLVPLLLPEDIDRELLSHLIAVYQPQYFYCKKTYEMDGHLIEGAGLEAHKLIRFNEKNHVLHPDLAVLLSTSGTTGSAKLVRLSYDNLYHSAEQVCLRMGMRSGQKGISPLSMSYVYGLTFCIWHWHCGAILLVTNEPVLSKGFGEFYLAERAEHFAGTPFIYQMLQKIHFWSRERLECLRWAMSAGSQMSQKDQISLVNLMGDRFWIMYGQTECTNFISGTNFDEKDIRLGTVGKLLEGAEAEIDDKTHELIIKSRNVSMGYATNVGELVYGDINQGILNTGDTASIDDDGFIYLHGRLVRYVKILGKRVSLDDVENYLANRIPNTEFACVGRDERISVFYSGENTELDKQISLMLDRNLKIPQKFVFCICTEEIPRNRSGKIEYAKLENMGIYEE